tara:strand:- start:349 stop:528 length:180 start_codon:yes stop_codon:yes gene_type:complete
MLFYINYIQCLPFASKDIIEEDLNRQEITVKKFFTLKTAIHRAIQNKNIMELEVIQMCI